MRFPTFIVFFCRFLILFTSQHRKVMSNSKQIFLKQKSPSRVSVSPKAFNSEIADYVCGVLGIKAQLWDWEPVRGHVCVLDSPEHRFMHVWVPFPQCQTVSTPPSLLPSRGTAVSNISHSKCVSVNQLAAVTDAGNTCYMCTWGRMLMQYVCKRVCYSATTLVVHDYI